VGDMTVLPARRRLHSRVRPGSEVAAALLDFGEIAAEYAAARELFNKQFNRLHDGHATERVINAFF
jgi:succinate dehydrogenase/fumarate reductase flavoprotein subunit